MIDRFTFSFVCVVSYVVVEEEREEKQLLPIGKNDNQDPWGGGSADPNLRPSLSRVFTLWRQLSLRAASSDSHQIRS
jgi:hypothetical protein